MGQRGYVKGTVHPKFKLAWNVNVFRHTEWVITADKNPHYSSQSVILFMMEGVDRYVFQGRCRYRLLQIK